MPVHERIARITKGIALHCSQIDKRSVARFLDAIAGANRVFIAGAGRSGLVARAFAMRLMHLGLKVHAVGEVTTPAAKPGDLLIIVSGSGQTHSMSCVMERGRSNGAKVAVLTSVPGSPIGKKADIIVHIKGKTAKDLANVGLRSPLGTPFELSAMVFLDSVIEELADRFRKNEAELRARHANLE